MWPYLPINPKFLPQSSPFYMDVVSCYFTSNLLSQSDTHCSVALLCYFKALLKRRHATRNISVVNSAPKARGG